MTTSTAHQVKLGPQGRLVIPAAIRDALDLKPGDDLVLAIEQGRLLLESRSHRLQRLQARVAALTCGVSLADELLRERRAEAAREGYSLQEPEPR